MVWKIVWKEQYIVLYKNNNGKYNKINRYCIHHIGVKRGVKMAEIYFTIAGMKHYYGQEFIKPQMTVNLVKEPDNENDSEAIKVMMPGIGHIGYVANSPYTVIGESMSAGRLYDKIGDTAKGTVLYVLPGGVLCTLDQENTADSEKGPGMYKSSNL